MPVDKCADQAPTGWSGDAALTPWSRQLRALVQREAAPFAERSVLLAAALRAEAAEPWREIRWARALSHLLTCCPITIRHGERLVGWHPNSPANGEATAEVDDAGEWLTLHHYDSPAAFGTLTPDLEGMIRNGLDSLAADLTSWRDEVRLLDPKRPEKLIFYNSAALALAGVQAFIRRYAALARDLAERADDPAWRAELVVIAATCEQVAGGPARTLREALQLSWFVLLTTALEVDEGHQSVSPGRLDQVLWPTYRAEQKAGTLDEADLDDLLDQFGIKLNEFDSAGLAPIPVAIGGRRPDGADAANALSVKLLESAGRLGLPQPNLTVLWHTELAEEPMVKACELLASGRGAPAFCHTDLVVEGLGRHGIVNEHAVDHVPGNGGQCTIAGRTNPWGGLPLVSLPLALLAALGGGRRLDADEPLGAATPRPTTWRELQDALDLQIEHFAQEAAAEGIATQAMSHRHRSLPLLSCFTQGCCELGVDYIAGGALHNFLQPLAVGVTDVVNGLAAIRALVFERQETTLDELRAALAADWVGHEALRENILTTAPRFARQDSAVDRLFSLVANGWCSQLEDCRHHFGGAVLPGFGGGAAAEALGRRTPATPDGRRAGEPLTPWLGPRDDDWAEVPSVLLLAAGLDQARVLGGLTFTLHIPPELLAGDDPAWQLKGRLEELFLEADCFLVEIESADAAGLRAAQADPAGAGRRVVRVGGSAVAFNRLSPALQNRLIAWVED